MKRSSSFVMVFVAKRTKTMTKRWRKV